MTDLCSDVLVLFGATGDLARRKLFPALYELSRTCRWSRPIVGVADTGWDDNGLRRYAWDAVRAVVGAPDEGAFAEFARGLSLVAGDLRDPGTYQELAGRLRGAVRPTHYVATPPSLFAVVAQHLGRVGLQRGARIVVEKPFGHDLRSARVLNGTLHEVFDERSVLRTDHYLGRESVENLVAFRFANVWVEPVWNRDHIASVQITQCETAGLDGRGTFYDSVGTVRDVVQNHLMVVLGLLAMEPPVDGTAEALRDAQVTALGATAAVDRRRLVRGQYDGYTAIPGVDAESVMETYVAMRLDVHTPRWEGVPFYLRAGKGLAATAQEVVVELVRPAPALVTSPGPAGGRPTLLRFRLGPDPGVTIGVHAKEPGPLMTTRKVDLRIDLDALGGQREAYERLLDDALTGDTRRFVREDAVEQSWRIVEPALVADRPHRYQRGSWGPSVADQILDGASWVEPEHR